MNETLITDLVSQQALDQLDALDRKMEGTLQQFKDCAVELAKGIKIPVEVTGDLERLRELSNATMQRASQAAQQYTQVLQQQQQVIANTSNTISRQLMEQERLNKAQREAYTQSRSALEVADRILGSHEQNIAKMAQLNKALADNKAEYKAGIKTAEEYTRRELELKTQKQELQRILANEQKMMNAAEGSYQQLSQQLERMKMAQKQLNDEQKNGAEGRMLEKEIQELDAHLKDLAADMGEFQRNVGNYAIANGNVRTELRGLTQQMAQMLADGVDPTSEAFLRVAERAGELKDAMADAQATVKDYANDTKGLTNTLSVVQTLAAGWQTFQGALSAFGMESEDAAKATQKLMGIMSLMQGVQKISTELTTNGTGAYRAYHAILKLLGIEKASVTAATTAETVATEANTVANTEAAVAESAVGTATEAATVASGEHAAAAATETVALQGATTAAIALRVALAALGIGAVIALIYALYEGIKTYNAEAEKAAKIAEEVSKATREGEKSTAGAALELKYYIGVVKDFNGSIEEEKKLVEELNDKYGESLGYYESLYKWKEALVTMGEVYIDVLEWEAIAQQYLNKYAEAQANGDFEARDRYEREFKEWKTMAAKQRKVLQDMIKLRGASTTRPTKSTTKSTSKVGTGKSTDDDAQEAEERMQELIKEANEMLDEWQKTATQRAIAITAAITSSSFADYKDQVESIRELYTSLSANIDDERVKAVEEKKKEFDEAIAAAKKYGKDTKELEEARVTALQTINNDYLREQEKNTEEMNQTIADMTSDLLSQISAETERNVADIANGNAEKLAFIRNQYLEELALAGSNEEKIAAIKKRYAAETAAQSAKNAIDTANATIAGLEKQLAVEGITDEERERLAAQLAKAKIALAKAVADAEEGQLNRAAAEEQDANEKRMKATDQWMHQAGDAIGKVADLMTTMYDAQISKIDELIEAEQERYEKEVENIDMLAEHESITKEEAEIRKRDAAAATQKKQEELEKRKSALEYKKAVTEKVNAVSQTAINTAVAIMAALAQFPGPTGIALAAMAGVMGAVQIATILAQPIKAYKEGTKGRPHPGGLALVGEGGNQELVTFDGKAWVTPDRPTLVDLPRGAEVYPDAKELLALGASLPTAIPRDRLTGQPVVINDYSSLESRVATNTKAVTKALREHQIALTRQLKRQKFNAYIASRT